MKGDDLRRACSGRAEVRRVCSERQNNKFCEILIPGKQELLTVGTSLLCPSTRSTLLLGKLNSLIRFPAPWLLLVEKLDRGPDTHKHGRSHGNAESERRPGSRCC